MNSVDSLNSVSPLSALSDHGLNSLSGSNNFSSVIDQAMGQAKTPQQQAELAVLQAKQTETTALASLGSDLSDSLFSGEGLTGSFGADGTFGIPSWGYDLERLLGNNSNIQQLVAASQQASIIAQSVLGGGTAGSGLGNSIDSLL